MKLTVLTLIFLVGTASAASNGKGKGGPVFAQPGPVQHGSGGAVSTRGGSTRMRYDARNAPPLSAERKVVEQDCTKPVDFSAGNLRCK